jgi:transcriptional regulator with XRE-family HTH domain
VNVMNNVLMMTLAEYMAEKNIKDAPLAKEVGCDRSMITKIRLNQATPSLPLAVKISQYTGVPIEKLIKSEETAGAA